MFTKSPISQSLADAISQVSQKTEKNINEEELIQIQGYGRITRDQARRKAADHLKSAADHLTNGHHSASRHHTLMAQAFLDALHTDSETSSIPKQ